MDIKDLTAFAEADINSATMTGVINPELKERSTEWIPCAMVYEEDLITTIAEGAGYFSEPCMINEGVDNSIGAGAKEIHIITNEHSLEIVDYGDKCGMDESTIMSNFCSYGNSSTKNNSNAPGSFGIGIKAALIELMGGREANGKITVKTHKKGFRPILLTIDVRGGVPTNAKYKLLTDDSLPISTSIVIQTKNVLNLDDIRYWLSVTYCWEMVNNKTVIRVNDEIIPPSDPLYRNNKHIIEADAFKSRTFIVNGEEVIVNYSELRDDIIPEEELNCFDNTTYLRKYKGYRTSARSGIFVRTGNRYYTFGNNIDEIMERTTHASCDGLRIEVIIPKSLWGAIGIMWNKVQRINKFSKVPEFNTSDADTSVYDYINTIIGKYAYGKKVDEVDKSQKKVKKLFEDITNLDVKTDEKFLTRDYRSNSFSFDLSKVSAVYSADKNMGLKMLSIALRVLTEKGEHALLDEIISKINSEYEETV